MTQQGDIVNKIGKLMKVANRSTFPKEAATALAKAQALMLEHKIEADTLSTSDEETEEVKKFNEPLNPGHGRRLARWKSMLAMILSRENGCFVYFAGAQIVLGGKPSNAERVRYLYSHCVVAVESLSKKLTKGEGVTYANNFRLGCVDAIRTAIKEQKEQLVRKLQIDCRERALVVINLLPIEAKEAQAFIYSKMRLRNRSSAAAQHDGTARQHGRNAGAEIYSGSTKHIS